MSNFKHYALISLILILTSAAMFLSHYLIFGQAVTTSYYSLMSVCLIPINILTVTIVFENIIEYKSKKDKMDKLNMLIGMFFSELGYDLMDLIIQADTEGANLISYFSDLKAIESKLKSHNHHINIDLIDIPALDKLINKNKNILVNLMSNDSILEHELFSDLLMAVMHLKDELLFAKTHNKDENSIHHIQGDIIRVYKNITLQWIKYIYHLEKFYPYLYKHAIQVNPFVSHDSLDTD